MVEKSSSCWRVLRAFMASTSLVVEEAWVVGGCYRQLCRDGINSPQQNKGDIKNDGIKRGPPPRASTSTVLLLL